MALTRGDKMIIAGAVALAVTVVLGLAVLKKPHLFGGGAKSPATDIPPAPTAAGPEPIPAALPLTAPPAAVATPAPATPVPAPVTPAPAPVATAPAPAATTPGKASPPQVSGDDSLEKMFEELANDTAPAGKGKASPAKAEPKGPVAATPLATTSAAIPSAPTAAPEAATLPEPQAAPAPGSEAAVAPAKPAAPAKAETKEKPQTKAEAKLAAKAAATAAAQAKAEAAKSAPNAKADAKPAAAPAAKTVASTGNVIRVVAEERPGEYVLTIQTNKAPASFERMFYTDPPRLVLDIAGSWNYNGPLSSSTGDAFIRQIRVGKHPDKFRVVLDMAPDAPAKLRGAPTAVRVPEGVALKIPK